MSVAVGMSQARPRLPAMAKIIYDCAVSLNGRIADEDGSLDWLFEVPGATEPDPELLPTAATVLVSGSTTYEWLLEHEGMLEEPEKWQAFHGDKVSFVFSSRSLPIPAGADIRLVSGSVADALPAIRAAAGDGDIWIVGGGDLAGQFYDAGALDVIAMTVAPAALSGGAEVLPRRIGADRLRLVEARQAGPFARLVYDVLPPVE